MKYCNKDNELCNHDSNLNFILFADDTTVTLMGENLPSLL